jgi:hypothetical protein
MGLEGSWPLWRESSLVVMGSFRGGLGVGWVVPEGVEDDIVGDDGWRERWCDVR